MALKKIFISSNSLEAQMVADHLQAAGFATTTFNLDTRYTRGLFSELPSIWVEEEQLLNAKQLIAEIQAEQNSHQHNWKCKGCSEESESQFTECWNCGLAKP